MDIVKFVKSCSPIILTITVGVSSAVLAEGLSLDSVSNGLSGAQDTARSAQHVADTGKQVSKPGDTASVVSSGGSLTETLVNKLGISPSQAEGGAGAIFTAAQSQLDAGQFAKLSAAVPEMDSLLSAAPKQSSTTTGLISGASSMLGGSSYGNLAGLASSFKDLNISPDMADQFVPVVVDYVKKNGGDMTGDILQSALYGN